MDCWCKAWPIALAPEELRVVVEHDPVFGPLIMLGEGGVEWRAEDQAAVALPPLNMNLARYLVIRGDQK